MPGTHDRALFKEERYLRPVLAAYAAQIAASRATPPHVTVAQYFNVFAETRTVGAAEALHDAEVVFILCNADGIQTDISSLMHAIADGFEETLQLPADRLFVPEAEPVDDIARFGPEFAAQQMRAGIEPPPTGNPILDMINQLHFVRSTAHALQLFIEQPYTANALAIHAPATYRQYERIAARMLDLTGQVAAKAAKAARIIERYMGDTAPPGADALTAATPPIANRDLVTQLLAAHDAEYERRVTYR